MPTSKKLAFVYSKALEEGGYPSFCPFNTSRAGKTRATIASMGLLSGPNIREIPPEPLTREELESFHTKKYLDALASVTIDNMNHEHLALGLGTPDCPVFPGMYDYACLAAGGSTTAAKLISSGEADIAFNPSGGFHHAGPDFAAGFCYINDIVLACLELRKTFSKVLFLDVDVHHCDGVQNAFYSRDDIMTISLHENGKTLFPGTGFVNESGEGKGAGYTVNIPLPVGTYDDIYLHAFNEAAMPRAKDFNPDVIVLELGMDALMGDPLAHLHLTNNVYAEVVGVVTGMNKPLLVTGGGGYNVENTVRGWALAWTIMCDYRQDDMSIGMGGVMLENTDWIGGLRDRALLSNAGLRETIDAEIEEIIRIINKG